jgi:hypothetical protein
LPISPSAPLPTRFVPSTFNIKRFSYQNETGILLPMFRLLHRPRKTPSRKLSLFFRSVLLSENHAVFFAAFTLAHLVFCALQSSSARLPNDWSSNFKTKRFSYHNETGMLLPMFQ